MLSVVMLNVIMLSVVAPGATNNKSVVPTLATTKQHSFAGLPPRKNLVKFLKFSQLVVQLINSN